eukprot:jgi/Chrzof1/2587/Cz11g21100.t1_DGAT2B[v5.2]
MAMPANYYSSEDQLAAGASSDEDVLASDADHTTRRDQNAYPRPAKQGLKPVAEPASDNDSTTGRDQTRDKHATAQDGLLTPGTHSKFPCGVRQYADQLDIDSRQNFLVETFAVLTMAIYLGWIHVLTALLVWAFWNKWIAVLLAGIWATVFLPAEPLLWEPFLSNPVLVAWRRYFRFSAICETKVDLRKKYVFAEYPHGVFPMSQLVAISLTDMAWPGHKIYSLAASSVFNVPFWRHCMTWLGARPATERNFKRLIKMGSVGLVPGGIAEMYLVDDHAEVIKIKDRKGFVRVAVEHGTEIIPVYHFGNSQLFKWGPKSWEGLSRKWRVALGFMFGRYNLPLPNR